MIRNKKVFWVVIANLLTLLSAIVLNIFVPKFFTIHDYAQYKTYTLYAGYVGVFHLGMINGIYLVYGGLDYLELPFAKFRQYSYSLMIFQLAICTVGVTIGVVLQGVNWIMSPLFFVIVNILPINIRTYFSSIDQFGREFKRDSILQITFNASLLIFSIISLCWFNANYIGYFIGITIINYVIMLIYACQNKDLVIGKYSRPLFTISDVEKLIKRGFFVMVSELMGMVILSIDSLLISFLGTETEFSMYSFSVSVIAVEFSLISVISNLIFPYLKRTDEKQYKNSYSLLKYVILVGALVIAILNFAVCLIVDWILPEYTASNNITLLLAPSVLIRGVIILVQSNFFKLLNCERKLFINNLIFATIGGILDVIAWHYTQNIQMVAVATVLTYFCWYVFSDLQINRALLNGLCNWREWLLVLVCILVEYITLLISDKMVGLSIYLLIVVIFAWTMSYRIKALIIEWKNR